MKISKTWVFFAIPLILAISSCGKFPGFSKTKNGLFYKFHTSGECDEKPAPGDIISFDMRVYAKDTVYSETYPVSNQMMDTSAYPGDLYEAISLMCEGDSATFILSSDSLNKYYGGEEMDFPQKAFIFVDILLREVISVRQQETEMDSLTAEELSFFENYQRDSLDGFVELSPGVHFKEIVKGKGLQISDTSMISLTFRGSTLEGDVFYAEEDPPLSFRISDNSGIPFNWNEALKQMKEGSRGILILTSSNAFGKAGFRQGIVGPYKSVKLEITIGKVAASPQDFERFTIMDYVKRNKITEKPGKDGIYKILKEAGTGELLKSKDRVMVHYTGFFIDNMRVFDSSHQKGQPIEVTIDESDVIEGWHNALKQMRVGEKSHFIIPSALAYGSSGYYPVIGPYSPLLFEMEVVSKL